jgi:hypothetical protein
MKNKTLNDRGIALVTVLLLMVVLTLLGFAANRNIVVDTMISSNHLSSLKAFYAAEAGAQYGFNKLWQELQKLSPVVSTITPPSMSGYSIASSSYISPVGGVVTRPTTGIFDGLNAFIQKYRVTSVATETTNSGVGKVIMEVEDQLIPIFQFGIFYQDVLEIAPGANMTFSGGRIHSNKSAHFTAYSGSTLSIDSKVTSAESVYRTDKANRSNQTGTVQIKDASSAYHALDIDSTSDNWTSQSQVNWNGRVKNDVHGVRPLNMPLPDSGEAIDIIKTGSVNTLYSKSGLRVINGVAKNKAGGTIDVRYYDPDYKAANGELIVDPGGTAELNVNPLTLLASGSNPSFYDGREQKTVTVTEINLAKLQKSTAAMTALNDPPAGGDAGILYVTADNLSNPAVRLTNGGAFGATSLPAGLSVATDKPLYVKGDYNTANRPAGLYADSVTLLSANWSDGNSSAGLDSRVAANTTLNAAIMAGNRNTTDTEYSGGVENFIRFLEKWSGKTVTYSGSIVCLWQSQEATKKWPGTGTVYNAPTRNWSYGINYNNLPPGTPRVRNVTKLGWRQVSN